MTDTELLDHIDEENVTYHDAGRGRSYRLWVTGHDYVTCTPGVKRLLAQGLVHHQPLRPGKGVMRRTEADA